MSKECIHFFGPLCIFHFMESVVVICFAAACRECTTGPCGKYERSNL